MGPRHGRGRRRRSSTDAVAGRKNPWQDFFDSNRITPFSSAKALVKENANVAFHFFADRLTRRSGDTADDLAPGRGQGRLEARPAGGPLHGTEDGTVHAVSARCTHLGCILAWNDAERTWDCPCHASRFAADGSVLQGPAVHPLEKRS